MRIPASAILLTAFVTAPAHAQEVVKGLTVETTAGYPLIVTEAQDGGATIWQVRPAPDQHDFVVFLDLDPVALGERQFSTGVIDEGVRKIGAGEHRPLNRWRVPLTVSAMNTVRVDLPVEIDGVAAQPVRLWIARPPFGHEAPTCSGERTYVARQGGPVRVSLEKHLVYPQDLLPMGHTASGRDLTTGQTIQAEVTGDGRTLSFTPVALGEVDITVTLKSSEYFSNPNDLQALQSGCVALVVGEDDPRNTTIIAGGNVLTHLYVGETRSVDIKADSGIDLDGDTLLIVNGSGTPLARIEGVVTTSGGAARRGTLVVTGDAELVRASGEAWLATPDEVNTKRFKILSSFHALPEVKAITVAPIGLTGGRVSLGEIWSHDRFRLRLEGANVAQHHKLALADGTRGLTFRRDGDSKSLWIAESVDLTGISVLPLELVDESNGRRFSIGELRVISNPTPRRLTGTGFLTAGGVIIDRAMVVQQADDLRNYRIAFTESDRAYGPQNVHVTVRLRSEGFPPSSPEVRHEFQIPNEGRAFLLPNLLDSADVVLLNRAGTRVEVSVVHDPVIHGASADTARFSVAQGGWLFALSIDALGGAAFGAGESFRPITGAGFSLELVPIFGHGERWPIAFHGGVAFTKYSSETEASNPVTPSQEEGAATTSVDSDPFLYAGVTLRTPVFGRRSLLDVRLSVGRLGDIDESPRVIFLVSPGLDLFNLKL